MSKELTAQQYKRLASDLSEKIDAVLVGSQTGVILEALCAVLGRAIVVAEPAPGGQLALVPEVLEKVFESVAFWNAEAVKQRLN